MLKIKSIFLFNAIFMFSNFVGLSQDDSNMSHPRIYNNTKSQTIIISDSLNQVTLIIDYSKGCKISQLKIKGDNILSPNGIYTGFRTGKNMLSTSSDKIMISQKEKKIKLENIKYSDGSLSVNEEWEFSLEGRKINWDIIRHYNGKSMLEETYFPKWNFSNLNVWKGGILDNGGMVWSKYLSEINDTYGVHTGGVTLWNPINGNALQIIAKNPQGLEIASKYSKSKLNEFTLTHSLTDSTLQQRYDLSRFVSRKSDVFAPFKVEPKTISLSLSLQYLDYNEEYSRGHLSGIDENAVRELLNTTARYGVVDNNIVGGNGWLTNWKCLHEPFFARIGLALNDPNYTSNLAATLDQERDQAILSNGRVLSRWHNAPGDEIPGTYNTKTGYYEAQWGYTIDSQTGYVINSAELFDLSGNLKWLASHKESCEKALDWLIKRDSNQNGIFEMMTEGIAQKKASDWLDIVWASYENAFVNAQMYRALILWAECEKILGDDNKANYYKKVAHNLKIAFNKPIEEGGFWSESKNQYVYWRDKDGSIHGDNLVTPVNFAAIAYNLCEDPKRITSILDQIEKRNLKENLFHWPLCFDSFKKEEVQSGNWPFPKYENGDIFPTWGYLGIRAYAGYDKSIALKYIKNILEQYNKDGLSSQRYSRKTQKGLGDDILSGISTTVTALYSDVYGISPKWNRFGLEPNLVPELNGTQFQYTLRDTVYNLNLSVANYTVSSETFSVKSNSAFGVSKKGKQLVIYKDNKEENLLTTISASKMPVGLEIKDWKEQGLSWSVATPGKYEFILSGLEEDSQYKFWTQGTNSELVKVNSAGILELSIQNIHGKSFKLIKK